MSVGLLRALVQNGKIPTTKAEELQKKLQNGEQSFTKLLFDEKIITPNALAEFVSTLFGYPMMDLSSYDPEVMPDDVLGASVCTDNRILPLLKRGNKVFLAVTDPTQFPQYQK
ncbi:MAG: type IV-A pilus assembly ATPase PilB, partial [Neisseriaceae bacterium]|nr:type IV-A pilus assembly ATPase PilB [Neisseriaceae bacterium]